VADGGVARATLQQLAPGLQVQGYMVQMGEKTIDRARFDWDAIDDNDFWCPDPGAVPEWTDYLDWLRKDDHNSVGAMIEVVARGVPAGIGAPVYGKLDADLAAAMMGINAVKGGEIGEGLAAAALTGRDNADEIFMGDTGPEYSSNHAGGILGGISTGQDIVLRFAVKPTSSILSPRRSIRTDGSPTEATRAAAERLAASGAQVVIVDAAESRDGLIPTIAAATDAETVPLSALSPEVVSAAVARAAGDGE
jgi:chorismate synthase